MKIPNTPQLRKIKQKLNHKLTTLIKESATDAQNQSNPKQLNPKKLNNILTDLDLLETKLNKKIVKALINHQLPINRENINNIKQLLSNFNNTSKALEAILFIKQTNLNLNHSTIKLLTDFLSAKPHIANNLTQLINNQPEKLAAKLTKFILQPTQENHRFKGDQLKKLIANLGLDLEKNLATNKNNSTTLKSLLLDLTTNNQQQTEIVNTLIDNLTTQKLMMHHNEKNDILYLYLQLPVQFEKEQQNLTTVHLNVYRKSSNSTTDEDSNNFSFILDLETNNLGPLKIELELINQELKIAIETQFKRTLELINHHTTTLKSKLKELGFKVSEIKLNVNQDLSQEPVVRTPSNINHTTNQDLYNIDFTI
ncbi:MAG: flagellar hook-length control protein FliK [Bacillota bacterium]